MTPRISLVAIRTIPYNTCGGRGTRLPIVILVRAPSRCGGTLLCAGVAPNVKHHIPGFYGLLALGPGPLCLVAVVDKW